MKSAEPRPRGMQPLSVEAAPPPYDDSDENSGRSSPSSRLSKLSVIATVAAESSPPEQPRRGCGCIVAIYSAAIFVLLWATFPRGPDKIWNTAVRAAIGNNSSAADVPSPTVAPPVLQLPTQFWPLPAQFDPSFAAAEPADSIGLELQQPDSSGSADGSTNNSTPASLAAADNQQQQQQDGACPVAYPRMTFQQVADGKRPYLFGAQPEGCKPCRRGFNEMSLKAEEHHYCEFWSQNWAPEPWGRQVCPTWLQRKLLHEWVERRWEGPLTLTPCDLWRFLGPSNGFPGRTLWVIGDSQSASLYEALKCFLHAFVTNAEQEDPAEAPAFDASEVDRRTASLLNKVHTACKPLGPKGSAGRLCYLRGDVWVGQIRDAVLPLLQAVGGTKRDIMVVNTGLHYSTTYEQDLKEFVSWYNEHKATSPFLVWKDTATQHFDQTHGEYPSGTSPPYACKPIAGGFINVTADHQLVGFYKGDDEGLVDAMTTIPQGGWRNQMSNKIMPQAKVPVSATYNETAPLWWYHRDNGGGYECTHFCAPSAPQVWLYGLVQTLRAHVAELNTHFGAEELTSIPAAEWPY